MKGKHHKHPPLKKPKNGFYHLNEWAIYGTTCDQISSWYHQLNTLIQPINLGYIDADHSQSASYTQLQVGKKHFNLPKEIAWSKYDDAFTSKFMDAVIVNGNHYPASRQIVIIDPRKRESLLRRENQLTKIDIVVASSPDEVYDFVKERMSDDTIIIHPEEAERISEFLLNEVRQNLPPLKALVLAGGKSKRMGVDKSTINYHGKPQQLHVAELCQSLGIESYISKQIGFDASNIQSFPVIKDRMEGMGPFGAILSAMMDDPDAAWLVLACDLPNLDIDLIKGLIQHRNTSRYATTYKASTKEFPEPLITIYEPKSYHRFLSFLSIGYACPRKVVINSDVEILNLENESLIENVNTPEEKDLIMGQINATHE